MDYLIIQSYSLASITKIMENSDLTFVTKLFWRLRFPTSERWFNPTAGIFTVLLLIYARPSLETDTRETRRERNFLLGGNVEILFLREKRNFSRPD